jgi:hypothetical protein
MAGPMNPVESVTTRVNCPHCGGEVSWTKSAQQAAEEARMTLARVETGLTPTEYIRPKGDG